MSEPNETTTNNNTFLNNFDGYVLIFCAIILSVLKIIELVLKKKQNNNFNVVSNINKEIESLKNDISTISGIQTSLRKTPETFEVEMPNDLSKRYSKSMTNINTKCQTTNSESLRVSTMDNKK